jgi:hypothetical protein
MKPLVDSVVVRLREVAYCTVADLVSIGMAREHVADSLIGLVILTAGVRSGIALVHLAMSPEIRDD